MKTLSLNKPSFSLIHNRLFFVRSLLMALHALLLVGFIGYQFVQPLFLNATTWTWAYLCLFVCFIFDFMFFYSHGFSFYKESGKSNTLSHFKTAGGNTSKSVTFFSEVGVVLDTILITLCLSMVLPALSSVLLFTYVLSILGAGLLWQYKGAFAQGLLVSFLFSCVLVLQPSFAESYPSLLFAFILNNIGFMVMAGLSGFLGATALKRDWLIGIGEKASWDLENLNQLIVENMNMGLFILDEDKNIIHSNSQARKLLSLPEGFSASIHQVFPEIKNHLSSHSPPSDSHQEWGVNRLQLECLANPNAGGVTSQTKRIMEVFLSPIKNSSVSHLGAIGWSQNNMSSDSHFLSQNLDSQTKLNEGESAPKIKRKSLILFQDMTQEREREKQEREQEKLAGIGRMAVGIAHEIRNPLSSVGGSIQLLDLDNKTNKKENKRLMDIALKEISRLNNIIGEFLSYTSDESALENLPTEPVEINTVLEELLDSVRVNPHWDHIKHHAVLQAHGLVEGRADKFKQIFWNVVKNACEAMSHQKEGCLTLETFDDNEWVVVRIKDNGCGISDKDKPFIYEPFYSKKEKGSGLGLAIARKLTLFYKGSLSYQAVRKGGTLFEIRFPLHSNPLPNEVAKKAS